jgi:hypothetical protein
VNTETPFDPSGELIVVNATIRGSRGSIGARMAIDTGAAATVVIPDLLDELGYSPREAWCARVSTPRSARSTGTCAS